MNSSVYLFGNLSSGYTVYPDESFTSSLFQKFTANAKAETQLAIHRNGDLMYYAYIRKLAKHQQVGLCVVLNGVILVEFNKLFALFENTIERIAEKGYLIGYSDYGELEANADRLYTRMDEIEEIVRWLQRGVSNIPSRKIPPVNYSVSNTSVKSFSVEDATETILQSSYTQSFTYIYKGKDFNTAQMHSYKSVLARVKKECDDLKQRNVDLSAEIEKVKRQKKQFAWVMVLIVAVLGCGILLLVLRENIQQQRTQIADQQSQIELQDSTITSQQSDIESKSGTIQLQFQTIDQLKREIKEKKKEIETLDATNTKLSIQLSDERTSHYTTRMKLKKTEDELRQLKKERMEW